MSGTSANSMTGSFRQSSRVRASTQPRCYVVDTRAKGLTTVHPTPQSHCLHISDPRRARGAEQFRAFAKFNEDYVSRQLRDGELSYCS